MSAAAPQVTPPGSDSARPQLASAFVHAFAHGDWTRVHEYLDAHAGIRVWDHQGVATAQPREHVLDELRAQLGDRQLLGLEQQPPLCGDNRAAVEFRMHVQGDRGVAEINATVWLHFAAGLAAECFHLPTEVVTHMRKTWFVDLPDDVPADFRTRFYLARIDGESAGFASWSARNGMVLLGGAATHPRFRRRHVYSSLLHHRLEEAARHGYEIAFIHTSADSEPIVSRCGFVPFTETRLYAWMPHMDPEVVASLADS